tara:strand:- start:80 stop:370 length:291 start_codon:yes stop_codon:yes gene_type:complete
MSRTTNSNVAYNWSYNRESQSHNGQFSTDGQSLYSYRQLIGITLSNGDKIALNYMSRGGGHYISNTTSQHVSLASRNADQIMNPDVAKEAGLINRL